MGRKIALVPNHTVEDGINAARLAIPLMWFDRQKTSAGVEALRQYRADYDEKTKAFRNKPRHDWTSHAADAARYMAMVWRALRTPERPKPRPPGIPLSDMSFDQLHEVADWGATRRERV